MRRMRITASRNALRCAGCVPLDEGGMAGETMSAGDIPWAARAGRCRPDPTGRPRGSPSCDHMPRTGLGSAAPGRLVRKDGNSMGSRQGKAMDVGGAMRGRPRAGPGAFGRKKPGKGRTPSGLNGEASHGILQMRVQGQSCRTARLDVAALGDARRARARKARVTIVQDSTIGRRRLGRRPRGEGQDGPSQIISLAGESPREGAALSRLICKML